MNPGTLHYRFSCFRNFRKSNINNQLANKSGMSSGPVFALPFLKCLAFGESWATLRFGPVMHRLINLLKLKFTICRVAIIRDFFHDNW
jgi:hypothetical protein